MDTGEWGGGGRGNRGRQGQFGAGGGRYNENYYGGGRGGGGRGGFYDQNQGGFYDAGRSGGRGRGGGYQGGDYQGRGGGYDGGQGGGGGYQGRGGGYDGGGYQGGGRQGGGGGRFNDGGGRQRFRGGRSWHNPNPGQKRQQQVNANPPPNLTLLKTIQAHTGAVTCLAYDAATNALFTGSKDGKIKQWDCTSGMTTHEETPGGQVDALLFIQGFLFVAYVKGSDPRNQEGIINFYNTAAGKTQMIPGHRGHINQLLAANNLLFSCGQDGSIRVWGLEGEAFVCKHILDKEQGGHTSAIYCLEMVNGFLFSGDVTGCIKIWDSASGTCTQTLPQAHSGHVTAILQYGTTILTASTDGWMKVWDLVSPPMPGAVLKPEPVDRFFGEDTGGRAGGRYRQGAAATPNSILTMDGTPDNKGESILAISTLFDGVCIFNVDQNMALLGALPQIQVCRTMTSIPGAAIIVGDEQGQVHIFSWTG